VATGDAVVTMDADLQDDPGRSIFKKLEDGLIVPGWKKTTGSNNQNIFKIFNYVTRISGIKIHDFNCGLKPYKKLLKCKSLRRVIDIFRSC
jgi:hypothetical protein